MVDPLILPATVSLVNSLPTNASAFYELFYYQPLVDQSSSVPFNTADSITFDLIDAPVITLPVPDQQFTLAEASVLSPSWTIPANTAHDFVFMVLYSGDEAIASTGVEGVDIVQWFHVMPGNTTSVTLPQTGLPMIGAAADYGLFLALENTAANFDYNAVFNFDVVESFINNFENSAQSESGRTVFFSTAP